MLLKKYKKLTTKMPRCPQLEHFLNKNFHYCKVQQKRYLQKSILIFKKAPNSKKYCLKSRERYKRLRLSIDTL